MATAPTNSEPSPFPNPATNPAATSVWYIAGAVLLLQLLTAKRYGYFGDEMYHMACGEHLAWGYVDQPPLIALVAWITRHLLGTSLLAIRLFPALAGCALVWLTGRLARELGGGWYAQTLASLCTACAGVYLVLFHLFTMNAFEPLLWLGCVYVLIRIINTGNQRLWLWFGLLAGVGLQNKYTIAVFAAAMIAGLLMTPERKAFASKWIWIAGTLAFLIFLPNLIWNIQHHWPFLELMRNIRASGRDVEFTPAAYIRAQIFLMTPFTFPVWLLGVLYFLLWRTARPYRVFGWTFLGVLAAFIALHGKDYYAVPIYPIVFAGGAIAIDQFASRPRAAWIKPALAALILLGSLSFLPMVSPVLSPSAFLRYQANFPLKIQPNEKSMLAEPMPHYYSWSFGWEEMVAGVAKAYDSLSPEERADTAIFGNDFAAAGAIDLLGPKYGLPKAISGHQTYWLWGPRQYSGQTMIILGSTVEGASQAFNQVTVVAELHHPYAAPWENRPVLLCRGLKRSKSLAEAWPRLKNWD